MNDHLAGGNRSKSGGGVEGEEKGGPGRSLPLEQMCHF